MIVYALDTLDIFHEHVESMPLSVIEDRSIEIDHSVFDDDPQ